MKKMILATSAFCASASAALAGGLVEPAMEPEVIATATRSSSSGILIPILILILIAAAIASNNGGGSRRSIVD